MISCRFENGSPASLRHVVVDNLVLKGDEILLVKRSPRLVEGGKWALVGGYVERDETIVEAVRRETLEETGYEVRDITLFRIIDNPDRPGDDRQSVSFVHFSLAGDKIGQPDDESEEQKWFRLDDLPEISEIAFDHWSCIQSYIQYRANQATFVTGTTG